MALAALCAAACFLLLAGPASSASARSRTDFAPVPYHLLQADIDEWNRRSLPTEVSFVTKGGQVSLITYVPKASLFRSSPDIDGEIVTYLYTRDNRDGVKVSLNDAASLAAAGWDAARPTKMVIHGFGDSVNGDLFNVLPPALLQAGDVNVIGVDWSELCRAPFYIEARSHVGPVGQKVATHLDTLVEQGLLDLSTLHILGHSLGAHVAGNVGKAVTKGQVSRITGMDPAMPLFLVFTNDRLAKGDAKLVDVVHTCAGFLGLPEPLGDVDFYPNGGIMIQPGCGFDVVGACSHGRSFEFMAESALEEGAFPAKECPDSTHLSKCNSADTANMGLNLRFDATGTGVYYLTTASSSPFDWTSHSRRSGNN